MRTFRTLPVALGLVAMGVSQAKAQQSANGEIYELITTAIHTRSSATALPVTVLSGDTLHEAARATLGETLGSQPGIQNASFGPAVGQTVVRGQQGRRVMNLTNGLPNADASGNSADHAQTVEAILANAIEVLRGPSTLLYGGGAIGGVVNVIDSRIATSIPQSPSFAMETRHDTAADLSTTVGNLNFATGKLVWHVDGLYRDWNDLNIPGSAIDPRYLDASAENVQGFIPNTGGRGNSGTGGVSWVFDDGGHLGFAYNRLNNRYGLPPTADAAATAADSDFVHIEMQRNRYDLDGEWHDLTAWAKTLSYKASYTDYAHAEVEASGAKGTQFANQSWQQRVQLTHTDTAARHGVVGVQRADETFSALGEGSFIPVTDIKSTGLFVVEDLHLAATTFEFGGRLNRDTYDPQNHDPQNHDPQNAAAPARAFDTYSLSGSALWDVSAQTSLGLSISHSQRAPSVEELYSNHGLAALDDCVIHDANGACEIGNDSFNAETSLNTDLTLAFNDERVDATLTGFYNRFNDYIGQIATGESVDGFPVLAYTQDDAHFFGIEMNAKFTLANHYALSVFGDLVRGQFDTLGAVPRMPPARLGAELRYNGGDWSVYGNVQHAFQQTRAGQFEIGTNAWTRLDLGADYSLPVGSGEVLLFVRAHNLTNATLRLSTSYLRGFAPEAGRSLEAGIRYTF
ncbi:MAG: TonB-dependent receptor [Pseudomonadales bacterium]|jgi:iron complex outermembrane receptor protein|nr:TonB-dependent receptor [Pseudomonadales bacterium]